MATAEDIAALIARMSRLDDAVAEAIEEDEDEDDDLAPVTEIRESAEDAPVIKLVNSIIAQAVEEGASDIHLEPDGRDMRVRFRVDGVLKETTTIPRRMVAGVVSRIKIMGDLDIAEKRVPQDGRVGLTVEERPVDVRIVTHAVRARRGHRDAPARQGPGAARTSTRLGMVGERPRPLRGGLPQGLRRGAGHRPDRLGQVDHALRGAERRSTRSTRTSSRSRTRSSTSSRASTSSR